MWSQTRVERRLRAICASADWLRCIVIPQQWARKSCQAGHKTRLPWVVGSAILSGLWRTSGEFDSVLLQVTSQVCSLGHNKLTVLLSGPVYDHGVQLALIEIAVVRGLNILCIFDAMVEHWTQETAGLLQEIDAIIHEKVCLAPVCQLATSTYLPETRRTKQIFRAIHKPEILLELSVGSINVEIQSFTLLGTFELQGLDDVQMYDSIVFGRKAWRPDLRIVGPLHQKTRSPRCASDDVIACRNLSAPDALVEMNVGIHSRPFLQSTVQDCGNNVCVYHHRYITRSLSEELGYNAMLQIEDAVVWKMAATLICRGL
mmetsp:Transcript_62154/g.110910  ORF Transcript_62154/g.110910 Transcript_62154/m.110910 type:complete len:316 (+) Transcript_62154:94-1041(+)